MYYKEINEVAAKILMFELTGLAEKDVLHVSRKASTSLMSVAHLEGKQLLNG